MDKSLATVNNLTDRTGNDPVADTIAFWKEHSGEDVSPDDAREIIENLSGFFRLLNEWDRCIVP